MLSSLFYKQCPKRRLDSPSPIAESANPHERQDNSSGEIKSWINLDESDHKITANASLEVLVPQSRYVTIELVKGVNVELGDISNHIIRLYARLQKTTADRDREHALALHEEQEKIRIKKQLTNNINHELKTPVAAIQGYLETLLANPSLDAQRRTDFLEKSAAQTERLRRLLADISTITRMDEASQLIQKERVVLNDLIAEVTADMELKPADQRLRVNIDFPQQVEIVGSPSLLASIFRNLADNAAAYSGGRDIFIRLLSDTPEECTVSFADNGIGIGEEHLPHIFERFYRIDIPVFLPGRQ